jgi:hypothetical protein
MVSADFGLVPNQIQLAHRHSLNGLPALRLALAPDAVASTASRRVGDDHGTPLLWGGRAREKEVIWGKREGKCFCGWGWMGSITLDWLGKLGEVCRRSGYGLKG